MKRKQIPPWKVFSVLALLLCGLAGSAGEQAPLGKTIQGIELSDLRWHSTYVDNIEGAVQTSNFRVLVRNHLTNPVQNVKALVLFYNGQDRLLTNAALQYKPLIGAGSEVLAEGYVEPRVRELSIAPLTVEDSKRDEKIAQLEKEHGELNKKMEEIDRQIAQRKAMITKLETDIKVSEGGERPDMTQIRRLQAERADLERQFNDYAVLRAQVARRKDELAIQRRLETIRQGIQNSSRIRDRLNSASPNLHTGPTNKFKVEFQILSFDRVEPMSGR